jgi:iron complex outermembrane receptor protein
MWIRTVLLFFFFCFSATLTAQEAKGGHQHNHGNDTADVFFRHLKLNEVTVTGVTGLTKLKHSTAPISIVSSKELRSTASTNIVSAIAMQPGMEQLTTGGGIAKPIIRGLGYNRVVVMSEGVRQEGQQWGDEHGVEVDGSGVSSVEILKGPASLMYGSDAMAGVVILHSQPTLAEGEMRGNVSTEYQTNNGLLGFSLNMGGNRQGFVWDARWSVKTAHAYKNKYDGYVSGSQFRDMAGRLMVGMQKQWGHSWLTWTCYHQTPGIIEGERDEVTGELLRSSVSPTSYSKSLPYQQVKHYKLVWDTSLALSSGWLKAIVGYQQNRRQEFEDEHHHEHEVEEHEAEEHEAEEHEHSADEPALYFRLHTVTYDVRYLTREFSGWKLSTGIQGMWQKSQNLGEEFLIPAYRLFDIGLYATASKQLDRWTLNGGMRYDYRSLRASPSPSEEGNSLASGNQTLPSLESFGDAFSRNFTGVTGSVGAVWNVSDHLNLRLNVARGFRAPNMSEMGANGAHHGALRYELGNHQLKPEYSLQADLGLDFTSRYVSAQVALFVNRIDNYIFLRGEGRELEGQPLYSYTQGDARLLGFEAGVDFHPVHSLHFENTFSYVDARLTSHVMPLTSEYKYLPYTPAPRWTSELKWELLHHSHPTVGLHSHHSHQTKGLSADNLYVAAGMECHLRQSHVYAALGTETATPAYALLRLSTGTDITWAGRKIAEFYITADNLLNRAYQSHLSRLKYADVNSVTGRLGVYNMGRNITFKLVVPIQGS